MTKRILIVDDEFGLADVVAEILTESGFEVAIAINGRLGLSLVRENRPDLILLDVMMPILDGPATLRELRAESQWQDIPVILMTALKEALPKDDPPLHQAVLHKPFSQAALMQLIKKLIIEPESPR
jgi:DNA-binding response OmpR family regulator